ncbi:MAG: potassium-transporting ATPase subunit C [Acidimicrobiales bacterium]|jgi:K+-transporting ATPase ATPase C chain
MLVHLRRSVIVSIIFLVLLGLAYPLAGTGLSQVLFRHQADGSLTADGSTLIGQQWSGPKWFQGRPDGTVVTTGPGGVVVSGTNQPGPRSKTLEKAVAKQAALLRKEGIVPTNDLVTTSGSLVDPDISPADAYAQVNAVAAARGLSASAVRRLVATHVHSRELGFLGADYVTILELNEALVRLG